MEVPIDLIDVLFIDLGIHTFFFGKWTGVAALLGLDHPRTVLTFQFQTDVEIQIRLLARCDVGLILVLAELAHLPPAQKEAILLFHRLPPQLDRYVHRISRLAVALEVIDLVHDVAFLHFLDQKGVWGLRRALGRLLDDQIQIRGVGVCQELVGLLSVDIDGVVGGVGHVPAELLVDVLGERVLGWCAPLVLLA